MDINQIEVTDEYRKVFEYINDPSIRCIFVTGQAGTGKSTLIDLIRSKISGVPVIAPTGVAALNVGGQTIHSFLRIAPGLINPDEIVPDRRKYEMFKRLQFLIIDEISMVRADLMDVIDISLQKNRLTDLPFGGVKLICIGDMFQLPPIVSMREEIKYLSDRYSTEFFFSANVIKKTKIAVVELTKVFRQKNAKFVQLLSNIREGINLEPTLEKLNSQYATTPDDYYITLTPDNYTAEQINEYRLNELDPYKEKTFEAIISENFDRKRMPALELLRLRVGARVMFLKNDQMKRWVNGSLGTVMDIFETGTVQVILDGDDVVEYGETVMVNRERWEQKKYSYNSLEKKLVSDVSGTFDQIPLSPAWACTIHKSQGKTFSKVNINITSRIFADGQLYVALSRCRTIEGIHISRPINSDDIIVNPIIISFYRNVVRC